MLLARLHGKWERRVGNTRFCSSISRMGYGAVRQTITKVPADGNVQFLTIPVNKYLLLKHTIGIRKNPVKDWKNTKKTSYHLKNMEKLWVNVSFQSQIVLGVKYQRAGNFKTMKESFPKTIPLWSPKNEVPCNGKR